MNIFSSNAAICTNPARHTRFIQETESSEPFVKGFTGLPGAFLKGAGISFGRTGRPKKVWVQFLFSC